MMQYQLRKKAIYCRSCGERTNEQRCRPINLDKCIYCAHHIHHKMECWEAYVKKQHKIWSDHLSIIAVKKGIEQSINHDIILTCKMCRDNLVMGCGYPSECNSQTGETAGECYILCPQCVCNKPSCRKAIFDATLYNISATTRCAGDGCARLIPGTIHHAFSRSPHTFRMTETDLNGEETSYTKCHVCTQTGRPAIYCENHGRHDRHDTIWSDDTNTLLIQTKQAADFSSIAPPAHQQQQQQQQETKVEARRPLNHNPQLTALLSRYNSQGRPKTPPAKRQRQQPLSLDLPPISPNSEYDPTTNYSSEDFVLNFDDPSVEASYSTYLQDSLDSIGNF